MADSWTYLAVDLGSISIPFLFSFHPKLRFDKTLHAFFPACFTVALFFIIWDVWFTEMGVWGFNSRYLIGINILNLPIEEWLFFLCIPYACLFTYHCLKILIKKDLFESVARPFSILLAVVLLITALLNIQNWYTALTFILTSAFLITHVFYWESPFLGRFYLAYFAILPMFFLTNGILTGSWIEEQVVWYNDAENLRIRLGTIPVEDSIYGMLLLMMVTTGYEWRLQKTDNEND